MCQPERLKAETPEDISRLFQERVAAGDVDSVLELYDSEAVFVDENGRSTRALREILAQLTASRPQMTFRTFRLVETDGIALMHTDWTRDGHTMPALEVARRQPDGSWRWLIGDPFSLSVRLLP